MARITLKLQLVKRRKPFGLTRHESYVLLDTIKHDLLMMEDVLKDPGYTKKQQKIHREYCSDLRKLIRRLRRFREAA